MSDFLPICCPFFRPIFFPIFCPIFLAEFFPFLVPFFIQFSVQFFPDLLLLLGTWRSGLDKVSTEIQKLSSTDCNFQGLSRCVQTLKMTGITEMTRLNGITGMARRTGVTVMTPGVAWMIRVT